MNSALAFGWCYLGTPLSSNQFAVLIDRFLRRKLPEGFLRNILNGHEAEIRQKAVLLLFRRYLVGNRQLRIATDSGDLTEVANQIQKSTNAAIRIATFAIRDSLLRDLKRFTEYDEDFPGMQKHCIHPACHAHISGLPVDVQRILLSRLLEEGITAGSISKSNARMVLKMVDYGMNQVEMAAELGVTRQAISQRISKLAFVIKSCLEKMELPFGSTRSQGPFGPCVATKIVF